MPNADDIPPSWRAALDPVLATEKSQALRSFLNTEAAAGKPVYPPRTARLAALAHTPLPSVRVVILGQDPYHGPGQAHGLSFSVPDGVKVPPSLANIYKELARDLGLPRPASGNLTPWSRQGVLLLNAVLTVQDGQPGSHQGKGWEEITDAVIAAVAAKPQPCVFLLWGSHARAKAQRVPGLTAKSAVGRHLILTAPHPSPLSAHRGFLGCGHFSQANAFLDMHGRGAVDWAAGLEPVIGANGQ
jgi:uracil-DNA glycosylase